MSNITFNYIYDDTDKLSKLVSLGLMSHAEANIIIDKHHGKRLILAETFAVLSRFPNGFAEDALIDHIKTFGYNEQEIISAIDTAVRDGYLESLPLGLLKLTERKEGKM